MFKIITFNANGIRAAERKGFFQWLAKEDPDAVCIQETKAQYWQLENQPVFFPLPHNFYHDAEKKGYSGTALYLKRFPEKVITGRDIAGWQEFVGTDGRYLEAQCGDLRLVSLYLHSGSRSAERQKIKEQFMAIFAPWLKQRVENGEKLILCGDFNIAHTEKDIKNWKGNLKNPGFLPHERAWLSDLFAEHFADAFRLKNQNDHEYTWWSQMGKARQNNAGWRIDYQIISQNLISSVQTVEIYREENFSDHAPLVVTYDF